MTRRMYTVATVHFQARSADDQHERIMTAVCQSGVSQDLIVTTMREHLLHAARMGVAAQLREMEQWTPDRWRQECGIRIASVPEGTPDGQE